MSYRDERNIVIAFAKAALLEKELVDAIEAHGRTPRTEAGHGIEKLFKGILAALLILICVFAVWIEYQRFREIALQEQLDAGAATAESARKEQELQIAKQQLQMAQQQIDANTQVIRDRAESDQAARVELTSVTLHPLSPNQPISITATMLNGGKTLALHAERTNTVVVTATQPRSFLSKNGWKKLGSLIPNFVGRNTHSVRSSTPQLTIFSFRHQSTRPDSPVLSKMMRSKFSRGSIFSAHSSVAGIFVRGRSSGNGPVLLLRT